MPWTNGPLTVYHGTVGPFADDIVRNGINLARCLDKTDFGRGFYTTRIRQQAIEHANQRYADLQDEFLRAQQAFNATFDPECAAVIEFVVRRDGLAALDTLAFVQSTPDWIEFVRHCRLPSRNHKIAPGSYYDVVYGPLLVVGSDLAIPDAEQMSVHSASAVGLLRVAHVTKGGPTL